MDVFTLNDTEVILHDWVQELSSARFITTDQKITPTVRKDAFALYSVELSAFHDSIDTESFLAGKVLNEDLNDIMEDRYDSFYYVYKIINQSEIGWTSKKKDEYIDCYNNGDNFWPKYYSSLESFIDSRKKNEEEDLKNIIKIIIVDNEKGENVELFVKPAEVEYSLEVVANIF